MPRREKLLTVTIDASLATAYRKAYLQAFGEPDAESESLQEFIAGFVEDRLTEEIEFAKAEVMGRAG
ncbi:MAG: hypothetical protein ABSD28_09620 [Tepidisphaeraceae bacterium]|jgi:hypothetical protein